MTFLKRLILVVVVLTYNSAFGLDSQGTVSAPAVEDPAAASISSEISEFNYQAPQGKTVVLLSPAVETARRSFGASSRTQSVNQTASQFGLLATHSFFNWLALELSTSIGATETTRSGRSYSTRNEGLSDISIRTHGYHSLNESLNLTFNLRGSVSPVKSSLASEGVAGNRFSGANSIGGGVGLEKQVTSRFLAGVFGNYTFVGESQMEAKSKSGNVFYRATGTGGNTLTVGNFAEYEASEVLFGLAAKVVFVEQYREVGSDDSYDYDPQSSLDVSAYSVIRTFENVEIKPVLGYSRLLTTNINGLSYDTNDAIDIGVSARIGL